MLVFFGLLHVNKPLLRSFFFSHSGATRITSSGWAASALFHPLSAQQRHLNDLQLFCAPRDVTRFWESYQVTEHHEEAGLIASVFKYSCGRQAQRCEEYFLPQSEGADLWNQHGTTWPCFQTTPLFSVAQDTTPVGAQDLDYVSAFAVWFDKKVLKKKKSCEKMWVVWKWLPLIKFQGLEQKWMRFFNIFCFSGVFRAVSCVIQQTWTQINVIWA